MPRRMLQLVLAVLLVSLVLPNDAEARRAKWRMLACNVDGTYLCGYECTSVNPNYCCAVYTRY